LPISTVKAVANLAFIVMIGVDLGGRDYRDISISRPGHHPADMSQHPPVVPYTRLAPSQKKILLGINIY